MISKDGHARKDEELHEADPKRGQRFRAVCAHFSNLGTTNVALAKAFGCSESAIRNWSLGYPINNILVKLLAALGISEKFLLHGIGPMLSGCGQQTKARKLDAELCGHLVILKELRDTLHHYEIDAVRGAIPSEEFGKFICAVAEAAAMAGKDLERRESEEEGHADIA